MLKSRKEPSIAYTNRPNDYWAVMSQLGTFLQYHGKQGSKGLDPIEANRYQQIGQSWIKLNKWLLQQNRLWPISTQEPDSLHHSLIEKGNLKILN